MGNQSLWVPGGVNRDQAQRPQAAERGRVTGSSGTPDVKEERNNNIFRHDQLQTATQR